MVNVQGKLMRWALREARKEKADWSRHLSDKKWMKMASDYSKQTAQEYAHADVKQLAKQKISYLKLRAKSGFDIPAQHQYDKITKKPMVFKGWVIGRKLIDDDNRKKNFTYYPHSVSGQPPFHFKTKADAMKRFKSMKQRGKFPADESNAVVFKLTKRSYLDRY